MKTAETIDHFKSYKLKVLFFIIFIIILWKCTNGAGSHALIPVPWVCRASSWFQTHCHNEKRKHLFPLLQWHEKDYALLRRTAGDIVVTDAGAHMFTWQWPTCFIPSVINGQITCLKHAKVLEKGTLRFWCPMIQHQMMSLYTAFWCAIPLWHLKKKKKMHDGLWP